MTLTDETNHANATTNGANLVSFQENCDDSLLAFAIDSNGTPYIEAAFKSLRDKLAILSLAESLIADLKQQAFKDAMHPSAVKLAA